VVDSQDIPMPADGEATTVRVKFKVDEGGLRRFKFRIPEQDGEQVSQNNARENVIEVLDRRVKLLYLEGEPRFEAKFIKQALEKDPNIQVVLLQRTAAATPSSARTSPSALIRTPEGGERRFDRSSRRCPLTSTTRRSPSVAGSGIRALRASARRDGAKRRLSSRRRFVYFQASSRGAGKPSSSKRAKAAERRSGTPRKAGFKASKACRYCSVAVVRAGSLMRRSPPA